MVSKKNSKANRGQRAKPTKGAITRKTTFWKIKGLSKQNKRRQNKTSRNYQNDQAAERSWTSFWWKVANIFSPIIVALATIAITWATIGQFTASEGQLGEMKSSTKLAQRHARV